MPIDFVDPIGHHVDCGASPGSAVELSLSWWMTPRKLDYMIPLDKKPLLGTVGWTVKMRLNGDIKFRIGSVADDNAVIGVAMYSANTRVHIVCTFGSGTAKIYADGVLFATKTGITQTPNDVVTAFRVGQASVSGTGERFDGSIEDVRVYDTVLTLDEIKEIFAAQGLDINMRILPHLQLRLPMRGQDGVVVGTVRDFSRNGYDGTPANSPKYVPGFVRLAR